MKMTSGYNTLAQNVISPRGIDREPYVQIPNSDDLADHSKENEVVINQQRRQSEKFRFFLNSFDFLNDSQIKGDYFEFGCHKARTFRMALAAAAFYNIKDISFHAFDSFEGLPDTGDILIDQWQPGALATSESEFLTLVKGLNLYKDKIFTHKGFYEQTLARSKQTEMIGKKAAFIVVDCDFYESAMSVFGFIEPFIEHGSVIYLDDAFAGFKTNSKGGVVAAFDFFAKKSKFNFIPHLSVGWWGRSFIASKL